MDIHFSLELGFGWLRLLSWVVDLLSLGAVNPRAAFAVVFGFEIWGWLRLKNLLAGTIGVRWHQNQTHHPTAKRARLRYGSALVGKMPRPAVAGSAIVTSKKVGETLTNRNKAARLETQLPTNALNLTIS
ncbi:MAG: hypothetical protein M3O03_12100 [Pseudomonadota bacterium]|nr:hypothetical protein [Pseudomonadota bacterium]